MTKKTRRRTHTGITRASSACRDCDWTATTRNALGLAARHADTTHHMVKTEQCMVVIYNKREGS